MWTDGDGRYTIEGPTGSYDISAQCPSIRRGEVVMSNEPAVVAAGATIDKDFGFQIR